MLCSEFFQKLCFEPGVYRDFCDTLKDESACARTNAPSSLKNILAAFANHTWFEMKGRAHPCKYSSGSGAGTSLADVILGFAITRVLHECRQTLLTSLPGTPEIFCSLVHQSP